ncbi:HNH endonuclease [Bordetella avium]|uniref:HNH endonuclease n=1 Tax=Bordetella avium TaxID=521 RepID=UPI000FDA2FE9|nr:HNH endonuclease signature motif containing protein [Bordetella avium]AZY49614.1 HNH endonuclease [Bordetella avium]
MTPSRKQVEAARPKFLEWLVARGAQVLRPTSEWELVRFDCASGVAIIYSNAKGGTTFTGQALAAWTAFKSNGAWSAGVRTRRVKLSPVIRTLLERDGDRCFFCHEHTSDDDRSAEHLVPVAHGGPNHISNLVLAHRACNARAGHLSAMEKIRIRDQSREQP